MNYTKIIFILFIFYALFSFSACNAPEQPEFKKIENVRIKPKTVDGKIKLLFKGDAILHNPNLLGGTITAMDFDIFIDDKKVSNIKQKLSTEIKGESDFALPLILDFPAKDVFKDIKTTITDIFKTMKINYKIDGHLTVNLGTNITVPVTYADVYEIKLTEVNPLIFN